MKTSISKADLAISKVTEQGDKVLVENNKGEQQLFDRVVVATPTTKIEEFLDPVQFADDIALLKQFRFEQGQLVIHTDPSVMPPKRKDLVGAELYDGP